MSVEERGRMPLKWNQFWFGVVHWLSCGSRDSTVSALPIASEDSSVQSPKLQEIQIMQPGVLCLTDLYTRAHLSEEIQPDATCLMDLNDDSLLEIIDRLDFEDRLRFRVNRRLKALEPAAVAIANTEHRMECEVLHCQVNERRQVAIELQPSRFDWSGPLPLGSGLLMFIRAIKCCRFTFVTLTLPLDIDDMAEVFKSLRFMKTEYFTFIPIGTHYPEDHSQHIVTGIISAFRNNELFKDARFEHAQTWASCNQLLTLIQAAHESRVDQVLFEHMNLECAQEMGKLLMGIDPALFARPPRDISAIRTSIKDKEVYVFKRKGTFKVIVKSGAGRITRVLRDCFNNNTSFSLCAQGPINYWNRMVRVPYREEEE